ncbi:MAG: FecR domain-containing protein [Cyclobacteriaceae bacterium]
MEHLIVKYLNNELSKEEWQELRQWLEKSDLNKTTLNNLKSFYSNINYEAEELEELVWQELKRKRLVHSSSSTRETKGRITTFLKVAAVLFIVSAFVFVAFQLNFGTNPRQGSIAIGTIYKVAYPGQRITTKLPDGSKVTLNSGSQISFPEQFVGNSREVSLKGEAFFEVEHNPEKPFFVKMSGDQVRVLGTTFNIRSYPEDSIVLVSVATGRVSYSIPSGEEVVLEPDQMAIYLPSENSLTTTRVDRLQSFGWKDRIIYFKSITFDNMVVELERWYGVDIEAAGDFKPMGPFTGEFRNEPLNQVLQGLSYIYHFEFKIEGKKVTLNKIAT